MAVSPRRPPPKKPFFSGASLWHSTAFRSLLYQALLLVLIFGVFSYLFSNAQRSMSAMGISTGFGFLFKQAEFGIGESVIPFSPEDTFLRAFVVALLNTLRVSVVSILFASIIGILVGIGRMSSNWLLRKISTLYVEVFRNTPQLVQIMFWYALLTLTLPAPRQALHPIPGIYLCNRGLFLALPKSEPIHAWMFIAFLTGCVGAYSLNRWSRRKLRESGHFVSVFWYALLLICGLPAVVWVIGGAPTDMDMPVLRGFNFRGGISLTPEFIGLAIGLSLYIASFIAEIVRSGIQSVDRGQIEAANAIALRSGAIFRLIVFPQALRVMIPPATAQYVSLFKNSSLGVAIGYPEIFNITNTATTLSGNTIECIGIMMTIYLAISFTVALIMNWYNKIVQIKER